MPNQKRDSRGRFDSSYWTSARDNPGTTAALAAGVAGVAAAGAFLGTRRAQIGEALKSGMDQLSEMKAERMASSRSQEEIAEEALTLKEIGKKSKGPRGPIPQQDIKAGMATAE
jgi:hypothetical protein